MKWDNTTLCLSFLFFFVFQTIQDVELVLNVVVKVFLKKCVIAYVNRSYLFIT